MTKDVYIGIDQTGAVNRLGKPKALPLCLMEGNRVEFFYLETFSKESIFKTLKLSPTQKIVACVDCVLGVPQELGLTWRKALELIKPWEGFGRESARSFFLKLGGGQIFSRRVEIQSRANSVFKEHPFQKNIQTGTYRFWKEIASSAEDFAVPFLGEVVTADKIPLYEGYPTLSWKLIFGVKCRMPDRLPLLIEKSFPDLVVSQESLSLLKSDPNFADAFVLALSLKQFRRVSPQEEVFRIEGWILGQDIEVP